MRNLLFLWCLAMFVAGCASVSQRSTQYQPPVAAATGPLAKDDASAFTDEIANGNAHVAIEQADAASQSVSQTILSFTSARAADCNSASMEEAISSLQRVDASAQHYIGLATSAPELSDREAAMDVLDELNGVILDGILEISKGYQSKKCFARAKHLLLEAQRVYQGSAYDGWKASMATTLQDIEVAERAAMPKPQTVRTPASEKKRVNRKS